MPVNPQDLVDNINADMSRPLSGRDRENIGIIETSIDLALSLAAKRNLAEQVFFSVEVRTPQVDEFLIQVIKRKYTALGYTFVHSGRRSIGHSKKWDISISYLFPSRQTKLPSSQALIAGDDSETLLKFRGAFLMMRRPKSDSVS